MNTGSPAAPTIMTTIEAPAAVDAPAPETPAEGAPPEAEGSSPAPAEGGEPAKTEEAKFSAKEKTELAKRYEMISKKEAKARKAEAEAARFQQTLAQQQQEIRKLQEQFRAELEAFRADPVGYELKAGRDPVQLVQRATTPETPEQKEIREIKQWKAQQERALQEREQTEKQRAAEMQRAQILSSFVGSITPNEFPALTTLHPASEVPSLVEDLLSQEDEDGITLLEQFQAEHRRNPTDHEIKLALEHKAQLRAKTLYESLKKIFEAPPSATGPSANKGPALSNQLAGQVETAPNGRPLTFEERRALKKSFLQSQLEAEPDPS